MHLNTFTDQHFGDIRDWKCVKLDIVGNKI